MLKIIVATHGKFSQELIHSAFMILGEKDNVSAITFLPGEGSEDLIAKYQEALKDVSADDQVIFLVDLFGGSPFNAAARIVSEYGDRYRLIAGVNLAMVIELCSSFVEDLDQLVDSVVAQGKESVVEFVMPTQDVDMDLDLEG
ncbi:PTS system, mannose-specific IIA component/PTS system, mannose-specific IIB component [Granulicatella balaenopterae]|uniref:PTS system, mannose-specific IIA component/PTS system, mannose-specific IIB component n=1 Tax=Granulicatella balaenopterae TaxID=137733 RepID=A0A1H9LRC3_9LACT|nr:PTS sugar transporter subunit IIA [Granulicatella balaenopterae]SER13940.1 PTS system, mannose-specific IIA component/PTS system, mannose-specific IIB component [Granulicatella balaenopterae]